MSQEIADLKALFTAFIDVVGFDIQINSDCSYELTKRPKQQPVPRSSNSQDYTPEFEEAWQPYPKRSGNNSKIDAFRQWEARLNESKELTDEQGLMISGVNRYAAYINAVGNEGTEFVMMGATFFGVNKNYMQEWALPKVRHDALKLPKIDEELMAFAIKHKLSDPRLQTA